MHKALKLIEKVLHISKQRLDILVTLVDNNRAKINAQDKRIKGLEHFIDKYITNNDNFPSPIDSELMINDPDDGSWVGR